MGSRFFPLPDGIKLLLPPRYEILQCEYLTFRELEKSAMNTGVLRVRQRNISLDSCFASTEWFEMLGGWR